MDGWRVNEDGWMEGGWNTVKLCTSSASAGTTWEEGVGWVGVGDGWKVGVYGWMNGGCMGMDG